MEFQLSTLHKSAVNVATAIQKIEMGKTSIVKNVIIQKSHTLMQPKTLETERCSSIKMESHLGCIIIKKNK